MKIKQRVRLFYGVLLALSLVCLHNIFTSSDLEYMLDQVNSAEAGDLGTPVVLVVAEVIGQFALKLFSLLVI